MSDAGLNEGRLRLNWADAPRDWSDDYVELKSEGSGFSRVVIVTIGAVSG